jgi:mannose-1-phosphate guanylyltransferase
MNKDYYAILMAGGVGSRFWPVSTRSYPKQFHDMLGSGDTLIQKTFKRLNTFIPAENILILTNAIYNDLVLEQLPEVTQEQVVLEPAMRNTSPCILYAALKIHKLNPNAVMVVAPSDHWIEDEGAFANDVSLCFEYARSSMALCTLGISPTFPNTGFGYIEFDKEQDKDTANDLRKVNQFREKPSYDEACSYLKQGNYLWNAGIFMWSTTGIIEAFRKYQPTQFSLFNEGVPVYNTPGEKEFIASNYAKAENISIDYAIMEKSDTVYVYPATFDWNDLGTWGSLFDKLNKDENDNAVVGGQVLGPDSASNMIVLPKNKRAVIEGLTNYIIVDKDDVLLIYPKSKEQNIKDVLAMVKEKFGDQYV